MNRSPVDEASRARAADALVPLLYADLRRLARHARWHVSAGATIQTTALVHEAYLKLRSSDGFADRPHFLRCAAIGMRHILVNSARDAMADKRGAGAPHVPLDEGLEIAADSARALIQVHEALERLRTLSERLAEVVECRFFAGYSEQETAAALAMSDRTVRRDWLKARAWLRLELDANFPAASAPSSALRT